MSPKKVNFRKTSGPDIGALREMKEALDQTEGIPDAQRWPLVMALLPDRLLWRVVSAREETEMERLDLVGTLALTALHALMGIEPQDAVGGPDGPKSLTLVIYGITLSCVAELEIRRNELCREIRQLDSPILYNPTVPLGFVPKEPGLKLEQIVLHYRQVSRDALADDPL